MSVRWWRNTVDINCDVDDVIEQIPTETLQNELEKRIKLKIEDLKQFEKEERFRTSELEITIDPSDYDLVSQEDVNVSDFCDHDIIDYLKDRFFIISKGHKNSTEADWIKDYLDSMPKWKIKEYMCDMLGLTHLVSIEEIINKLKEKIV